MLRLSKAISIYRVTHIEWKWVIEFYVVMQRKIQLLIIILYTGHPVHIAEQTHSAQIFS